MEMKRMENYGQRQQKAWITMTLIVLNILYFVYLEAVGSSEDVLFMLEHGAMFGPLVLDGHEYYRLLTAVFMHFGINHIVNNMLVLFVLALVLVVAGWKMTGQLAGLGIMIVGVALLLAVLYIYNNKYQD